MFGQRLHDAAVCQWSCAARKTPELCLLQPHVLPAEYPFTLKARDLQPNNRTKPLPIPNTLFAETRHIFPKLSRRRTLLASWRLSVWYWRLPGSSRLSLYISPVRTMLSSTTCSMATGGRGFTVMSLSSCATSQSHADQRVCRLWRRRLTRRLLTSWTGPAAFSISSALAASSVWMCERMKGSTVRFMFD